MQHSFFGPLSLGLAFLLMGPTCSEGKSMATKFALQSPAFKHNGSIPTGYTCDGADISPELIWKNAPHGTASFALIMEDPDAPMGNFVHWLAWNINKDTHGLTSNVMPSDSAIMQGINSAKQQGYHGPCPPSGSHRYYFRLYALKTALPLTSSANKADLEKAMDGAILGKTELMGTYSRNK
jgi:Raf kinase inhibitor-like YbhB/YbcL family protein